MPLLLKAFSILRVHTLFTVDQSNQIGQLLKYFGSKLSYLKKKPKYLATFWTICKSSLFKN